MSVPIRDERLLVRAERDLRDSDEIEVTIETRWAEEGIPKLCWASLRPPHHKTERCSTSGKDIHIRQKHLACPDECTQYSDKSSHAV